VPVSQEDAKEMIVEMPMNESLIPDLPKEEEDGVGVSVPVGSGSASASAAACTLDKSGVTEEMGPNDGVTTAEAGQVDQLVDGMVGLPDASSPGRVHGKRGKRKNKFAPLQPGMAKCDKCQQPSDTFFKKQSMCFVSFGQTEMKVIHVCRMCAS